MLLVPRRVSIEGFRSVRRLAFPVERLTVFEGANGVGKTNLFRALQLAQFAARGTLSAEVARDGGLEAVIWAGRRRQGEAPRLVLEVDLASARGHSPAAYAYRIEIGFPQKIAAAAFAFEPQVKEEALHRLAGRRRTLVLRRRGPNVVLLRADGTRQEDGPDLLASETALSRIEDAGSHPEIDAVRRSLLDWRFHHGLRTDSDAPLRRPAPAVASPTLDEGGGNLAAVLATLAHIRGDTVDLDETVADAFPGARLEVPPPEREATFGMVFPEHPQRLFGPGELSDGTLRFLAMAGALLSYRRPSFLALNEPEASLHPALLPPLARLVARGAADGGAIWLVTHSPVLASALAEAGDIVPRQVVRDRDGATTLAGLTLSGDFRDEAGDADD